MTRIVGNNEPAASSSIAVTVQQKLFSALVRKGLRQQGAFGFIPGQRQPTPKAGKVHSCEHRVAVHSAVPHPKYGKAVPHFRTWVVQDIDLCVCKEAKELRKLRIPVQTAQAAAKATRRTTPDPSGGPVQCSGTTKLKLRCRTKTLARSGFCTKHEPAQA